MSEPKVRKRAKVDPPPQEIPDEIHTFSKFQGGSDPTGSDIMIMFDGIAFEMSAAVFDRVIVGMLEIQGVARGLRVSRERLH